MPHSWDNYNPGKLTYDSFRGDYDALYDGFYDVRWSFGFYRLILFFFLFCSSLDAKVFHTSSSYFVHFCRFKVKHSSLLIAW